MRAFHFFRCPRCGHVEETALPSSYVEHPCPQLRGTHVACVGFTPEPETNEEDPDA